MVTVANVGNGALVGVNGPVVGVAPVGRGTVGISGVGVAEGVGVRVCVKVGVGVKVGVVRERSFRRAMVVKGDLL